jgi:hypothetical protein
LLPLLPLPPLHVLRFISPLLELCGDDSLLAETECSKLLPSSSLDDEEYDSMTGCENQATDRHQRGKKAESCDADRQV